MDKKALAIDIGGTKIYSAVIGEKGEFLSEIEKDQTPKSLEGIKKTLLKIIEKHQNSVDVVAIASAGTVDKENSRVTGSTANLVKGYSTIDFSSLSNKKVYIENDANCAAWAEYKVGAASGFTNNITLTLGTGVGSGIIIDGKLLKGKSGAAGEMHFKLSRENLRKCTCGAWDCWEIYASGNGLRLSAVEATGNKEISTYDVIEGVKNGNKKLIEAFNIWRCDITAGLIGLANIFDPDCIVLSGSMAQFCDTAHMEEIVNKEIVAAPTKISHASAGNYSGMIGAALLAMA